VVTLTLGRMRRLVTRQPWFNLVNADILRSVPTRDPTERLQGTARVDGVHSSCGAIFCGA